MKEMTPRERIEAVIRCEKPDHVPIIPMLGFFCARYYGIPLEKYISDGDLGRDVQLRVFDEFGGWDVLYVSSSLNEFAFQLTLPMRLKIPGRELPANTLWQFHEVPVIEVEDYDFVIEHGLHALMGKIFPKIRPYMDPAKYPEYMGSWIAQTSKDLQVCEARDLVSFAGVAISPPFDFFSMGRSLHEFTLDLYRRPEKVLAAIEAITPTLIEDAVGGQMGARHASQYGYMTNFIGATREAGTFISPKVFEKFAWPSIKQIALALLAAGITPLFHFDSDWTPMLEFFKDLPKGTCILDTDSITDIFKAKQVLGGHMCLMGDVPPALLKLGTPEQVSAYVRRLCEEVGDGGGYILGTGCEAPRGQQAREPARDDRSRQGVRGLPLIQPEEPAAVQVDFEPLGKRIRVAPGVSLLGAARMAGVALNSVCGGDGDCGQCQVHIRQGRVSPLNDVEEGWFRPHEIQAGLRLACQAQAFSDIKVDVPARSLASAQRLQVEGGGVHLEVDAPVRGLQIALQPPSLQQPRSDLEQVLDALEAQHGLQGLWADPAAVRQLPAALRHNDWRITVYARGEELVGFAPPAARCLGLAIDLGSTKIAAYLVDLESGDELAAHAASNPQISYGEDVVSRIDYTFRQPDGAAVLSRTTRAALDELAGHLCAQAGASRSEIAEVCLVGNTAMTHLLLELPVRQLVVSPFVAASALPLIARAQEIGLSTAPAAVVYIPPGIAGFVGADHVAMLLASDLDRRKEASLGIDIGTNTEIGLALPGRGLFCASCASGPAFEGAHIRHGMRAASGAIERVRVEDGRMRYGVIANAAPVGICGSGMVDLVAELHRVGALNFRGRLQRDHPLVRSGRDGAEVLLVPVEDSGVDDDIVVTQKDIDEILLAKGAIKAGVQVLLKSCQASVEDLAQVVAAGAFGSYLNLNSATAIGLLPPLPVERIAQVGNAVGDGAKRMLVSRKGTAARRIPRPPGALY